MTRTIKADEAARFAPGTFGCHEALHMASVLAETVDEQLCEHPAVQLVPEWKALADRAAEALHDLYQAIGARHGVETTLMPKGSENEIEDAPEPADAGGLGRRDGVNKAAGYGPER